MPTPFTEHDADFLVAAQITPEDIAIAKTLGVTAIIKNRPDFEEPGQPETAELRLACDAANITFIDIPVDQTGIGPFHIDALEAARGTHSRILAYCRTGTRSTILYGMARARAGDDIAEIIRTAKEGNYDLSPYEDEMRALTL